MEIIRNMARRKLRSVLTISGIVIGIFALTTMGAMAEHFSALVGGGVRYYGASIQVTSDGGSLALLSDDQVARVGRVEGVAAAYPVVQVDARPGEVTAESFGPADYIASRLPEEAARSPLPVHVAGGRDLVAGARGEVLLGSDIARELRAGIGTGIDRASRGRRRLTAVQRSVQVRRPERRGATAASGIVVHGDT